MQSDAREPEETIGSAVDQGVVDTVQLGSIEGELVPDAQVVKPDEAAEMRRKWRRRLSVLGLSFLLVVAITLGVVLGLQPGGGTATTGSSATSFPSIKPSDEPSVAPSAKPSSLESWYADLIQRYSPWTSFDDPDSAQSQALRWISSGSGNVEFQSEELLIQRFALSVLSFAANLDNESFPLLPESGDCNLRSNTECDEDQHITALTFEVPPALPLIHGPFPPEMGLLTRLTRFLAPGHEWFGTLPTQLGLMRSLRSLDLTLGSISVDVILDKINGPLPTEIGNLGLLESVVLDGHSFDSPLPTALWKLTKLTTLSVGVVSPFSIPSEIGRLHELSQLNVAGPQFCFSGTIPTEIGLLRSLREIPAQLCSTGTLPAEIGGLVGLESFYVPCCVRGTIPTEIGKLTQLRSVEVSRADQLSGELPSELGLLSSLTSLLVSEAPSLSSTIPTELGLLGNLATLALQCSQGLRGTVPSGMVRWDVLSDLRLLGTGLTGELPPCVGEPNEFFEVDLDKLACGCCVNSRTVC